MPAAAPETGPLEAFASVAIWCVVPIVTLVALIVLHEAGHALVARMLGFRVTTIAIGGGPAWLAFWVGRTLVLLNRWPYHGVVHLLWRRRSWLRTRMVSVFAAGPATTIAGAAALSWWAIGTLEEGAWSRPVVFASFTAALCAGGFAVMSLLSFGRLRNGLIGDMAQILNVVRLDRTSIDAMVDSAWAIRRADYWADFLRGQPDAARHGLGTEPPSTAARCDWHVDASLFAFARDGATVALEHQRRAEEAAERLFAESAREGEPSTSHHAARNRLERLLQVNRAFYLAHSDVQADLAEAIALAEQWRARSVADAGLRLAETRTRGVVMFQAGRLASGIAELQRAVAGSEEYWLRALAACYLAHAYALQGERSKARRFVRMAKRLAPRMPLVSARLGLVEQILRPAAERARRPAIR